MATLKKLTRMGADVRQIARLLQAKAPEGHMLAYITPDEAKLLKSQGGSGKEHENTGVPSFEMGGGDYGDFYDNSASPTSAGADISSVPEVSFQPEVGGAAPVGKPEVADISVRQPSETTPPVQMDSGPQFAVPSQFDSYANLAGKFGEVVNPYAAPQEAISFEATKEPSATLGQKYRDLAKGLGVTEDQLGKLGIAGVGTLYNAYQTNKAQREAEAAKREQQGLATPYQKKGAELQRQAQSGELTPEGQRQLQSVQAQAAQASSSRGGVGAQQSQAQIEALRSQLLQQQYDYGLKLSGIGDQIALGAIKTGLEADRYVQNLNSSFYNNMMYMLGGMQPPAQAQQRTS
jgi:hypothetical protein